VITPDRTFYIHSDNIADTLLWMDYIQFRIKDNIHKRVTHPIAQSASSNASTPTNASNDNTSTPAVPPRQKMSALIANISQTIQAKLSAPDGQSAAGKEKDRFARTLFDPKAAFSDLCFIGF